MTAPVMDQFSTLDAKLGDIGRPLPWCVAKTWVPDLERRRIVAYEVRNAYRTNQAWRFIASAKTKQPERGRREYGDPALYEDRMVAAIRGDSQTIVIPGADDDLLDGPALPEMPTPPKPDAAGKVDELVQRIFDGRMAAWKARAGDAVKAWEQALERQPSLQVRLEALRGWAETSLLSLHLTESEHDAVGLGDSLVVLWPRKGDWPSVTVDDPGGYFPVIPANGDQADFPDVVHVAWEYREFDRVGTEHVYLRRQTWELVSITALRSTADERGQQVWTGPDGVPLGDGDRLVLPPDDTLGADGIIRRKLPWHGPDDPASTVTCVFSDATWDTKDIGSRADALELHRAVTVTQDRFDLGIDFLPVVHRPNTLTGKAHFGRSLFDLAVGLFDDLARVDTLAMSAANYLGHPTIGLTGATAQEAQMAPGRIFNLGPTGNMDVLDLSSGIEQLMRFDEMLQDRLGVNLGLPGEMTGRASGGDTTSGAHLLLKLLPAISVVGGARQVREPKDGLILKFAQRMAQVAGALEPGPTPVAHLRYGNFLPTDLAATTSAVSSLMTAHAISTQTAVSMLVAAGLPIDDARAEVDRIVAEDTESAVQVADALGGAPGEQRIVAERLGVELDAAAAAPPPIVLPPAPGGAA